jgi:hypothetical protein
MHHFAKRLFVPFTLSIVNWALHQKEQLSQGEVARSFGVLALSWRIRIRGVVVMASIL